MPSHTRRRRKYLQKVLAARVRSRTVPAALTTPAAARTGGSHPYPEHPEAEEARLLLEARSFHSPMWEEEAEAASLLEAHRSSGFRSSVLPDSVLPGLGVHNPGSGCSRELAGSLAGTWAVRRRPPAGAVQQEEPAAQREPRPAAR